VTLTVTEKGYELEPEDLARPDDPRSAPAVVAHALARRRLIADPPPVVASLDNVLANGTVLRERVLEVAERLDPTLPAWIAGEVRFPCSVVDRMVPATTDADLDQIGRELGLIDLAAVTAEHHRSWTIADEAGLPPLSDVGVRVVGDIGPFEQRKLWLLNGAHSAFAYCGLLAGCETIAASADHPQVSRFVRHLVDDVLAVADLPREVGASAFAADALRRFRNPNLGHTCTQVGADGSRKLPQRLVPVVAARRKAGLPITRFAIVIAAWIAATAGLPVRGSALASVDDPAGDALRRAAAGGDLREVSGVALAGHGDPSFVVEVAATLERLVREGATVLVDQSSSS
jgi:fructuronate reductase